MRRSGVIVGQDWRYSPQMTLNNGNSRPTAGAKRTKHRNREGALGPLTRMTRNPCPSQVPLPRHSLAGISLALLSGARWLILVCTPGYLPKTRVFLIRPGNRKTFRWTLAEVCAQAEFFANLYI